MAKLTLSDLANLNNQTSAVTTINNNSALIEAAIENTLSRDGTAPNEMNATLDMNSNRIINLPEGITDGEPVTVGQLPSLIDDITQGPPGPPGPSLTDFETRAEAENTSIPLNIEHVRTAGSQVVGDGGSALYKKVPTEPTYGGKFQSDDGAWWEVEKREVWADQFIQNEASNDDKRAALERAFSRLGSGGGIVHLTPGKDYNISGLDIPPMCVIQGPYKHIDTYADGVTYTGHGTFRFHKGLVLESTGTISTYGSAGLVDCFLKRDGWVYTDDEPTNYAGVMMTSQAYAPILKNVMGIGFGTLLETGQHPRVYIDKLYGDPLNGLDMDRAADVTRIRDVHLWPFGTIEGYVAGGAVNTDSLLRSGTALKWRNGAAGSLVDGFFSLGYTTGIDLEVLSTLQATRLRCELPPDANAGSIGLKIGSSVDGISIGSLYLSGYEKGIQVGTTANARADIGFFEMHLGSGTVLEVLSGDITVGQAYSWNRDGIIVDIQNTASHVHAGDWYHRTAGGTITNYVKVPTNGRTDRIKVNMRNEQANGGSIISGGPFVFPGAADSGGVIDLSPQTDKCSTGTTAAELTTINGGWTGREVSILFVSGRTINGSGNILLTNDPLVIPAGVIITLMYNGSKWVRL